MQLAARSGTRLRAALARQTRQEAPHNRSRRTLVSLSHLTRERCVCGFQRKTSTWLLVHAVSMPASRSVDSRSDPHPHAAAGGSEARSDRRVYDHGIAKSAPQEIWSSIKFRRV